MDAPQFKILIQREKLINKFENLKEEELNAFIQNDTTDLKQVYCNISDRLNDLIYSLQNIDIEIINKEKNFKIIEESKMNNIKNKENELSIINQSLQNIQQKLNKELQSIKLNNKEEIIKLTNGYDKVFNELNSQELNFNQRLIEIDIFLKNKEFLIKELNELKIKYQNEMNYADSEKLRICNEKILYTTFNSDIEKENMIIEEEIEQTKEKIIEIKNRFEKSNNGNKEKMLEIIEEMEILERINKDIKLEINLDNFEKKKLIDLENNAFYKKSILKEQLNECKIIIKNNLENLTNEINLLEIELLEINNEIHDQLNKYLEINRNLNFELKKGEFLSKAFYNERQKLIYFFDTIEELINNKNNINIYNNINVINNIKSIQKKSINKIKSNGIISNNKIIFDKIKYLTLG